MDHVAKDFHRARAPSLAFREYGTGRPLVVVHGLLGSSRNWHGFAKRLQAEFRVLAVDLRNHGDSPWTAEMALDDLAGDLARFLDEHALAETAILGHSLGGKAAMLLALSEPDRISQLVVADIAPVRYDHDYASFLAAMRGLEIAPPRRRSEAEQALIAALGDEATARFLAQNLATGVNGLVWKLNIDGIAQALPGLLDFPSALAASFPNRALFVRGSQSDYIAPQHQRAIFALFPQAEFAVIGDAGHRVHADQPVAFADRVVSFLDSAEA